MICTCGYRFCFDPKTDRIADRKFVASIHAASSGNTYYYTENQLFTALCHKKSRGLGIPLIGRIIRFFWIPPTAARVSSYVKKWQASGNRIEMMIEGPSLHDPPPRWKEPDIYEYGVERVLIVERDVLVDLFVLNGFHSLQRVLILSESGYPEYLGPIAAKALKERHDLPVYLLHDSKPHGLGMAARIEKSTLPLAGHPIVDLGITRDDVRRIRHLRATKPERWGFAVPVDLLLYPVLAGGLSQVFEQNMALGTLLASTQKGTYHDTSCFG